MRGRSLLLLVSLTAAAPLDPPLTIAYGADPLQQIDVTPAAGRRAPLVIFVHGGTWMEGDKAHDFGKAAFFTARGNAFATINYRLVPRVTAHDQAVDVAAAIAKLRSRSASLGIDPDRIGLIGHSAGGQLIALIGTDERYLEAAGVPMKAVRAIALLDGAAYNIPAQVAIAGPSARKDYLAAFGADRAGQWAQSPVAHAAAPNVAAWGIYSIAQRSGSQAQADEFAAALRKAGAEVIARQFTDYSHADINQRFGRPGDPVASAVGAFFKRAL